MKTKISRISRRTVSIVLAVLMMVSVLGFGSLITASALSINLAGTFNNWNANDSNYSASSSPASWDIEFANTNEVQFKVVIDGNWSGITSNNDGYYGSTLGVDKQIYKNAGGNIHWTPPSAGTYTFTVSGSGDSYSLCITEASSGGGGGGDGAVTDADLLAVLNGTKVMFYGGELTNWGQSTMYINTTNSASNVTASASLTGSYNLHSQGASRFALFTATSQRYYMAHQGWNPGLQTSAAVQAGEAYIVRGNTDNSNFTQQAKSGSDYLYKISNSATTTATTTIDSSITQSSNLSVSTSTSAGNSVLGIANSFEYYLYDGSSYYKVTPSSGEIDTSELAVGSGYKVITVLKDTNGLRVKADEDTFSVTAGNTCTLTLDESTKQTLNIGETFDLTVSSEHCTGSASNLSITSDNSTYVSSTLKSTGSNSRTYTIKALKPTSSDVTLTAACSADSDENQPTLKVAVRTPALSFSYDPATILTGGNTSTPSSPTASNANASSAVSSVSYVVTSGGTSGTIANASNGIVTSTATAGTVTVTATGTVSYNGVSYTSATGTASVTVTAPKDVYMRGLTSDYTWDASAANKMTYNSSTGLYEITRYLYKGATTYNGDSGFKIYHDSKYYGKNYTLTTSATSAASLATDTQNVYLTTKDVSSLSRGLTNDKAPYKFTYNIDTKTVTVYYPMKVTYNANGHGSAPGGEVVAYGGTATAPTAPTAAGYTFGGWFKEAGCTNAWDFSTDTVTADTVLYAKWTVNSHTLTVNAKYKSSSSGDYTNAADFSNEITMAGSAASQSKSLNYNATCALVAPDKSSSGYDFVGWYDGDTRKSTNRSYTYTMPDENKTLTARYNKQYTLTLSSAHGTIKDSAGTNTISKIDVFYDDTTPANFKVQVSNGWKINNAGSNATTINKYFTQPANGSTGTVTFTGATVATANKVDATITVDFTQITMPVDIGAYKTDDIDSTDFTPWDQAAPTISPALTSGTTPWSTSNSTVTKNGTTPAGYEFVGWYYSNNANFDPATISRTYTVQGTGNTKTFAPNGTEGTNRYSVYALYKKTKYTVVGSFQSPTQWSATDDTALMSTTNGTTYTWTNNFTANQTVTFKIVKNNAFDANTYVGDGVTYTETSEKTLTQENSGEKAITLKVSYSGNYEFSLNTSTNKLTITYPTRNVSFNTNETGGLADPDPEDYIDSTAYSSGDTWNLAATEDDLYTFVNWTYTVDGISNGGGVTIADSSSMTTTAVITTTGTVVITANYSKESDHTATILARGTDDGSSFAVDLPETGFSYTQAGGASISYTAAITSIPNGTAMTFTAPATITSGSDTYKFIGWYNGSGTELEDGATLSIAKLKTNETYYARYIREYYITVYNTWMQDDEGKFHFVAAPPKTVAAGGRVYTYAAGELAQRGEDNQYANSGTASVEHKVSATGTYYEGNKLVVYAGETVTLTYSSLATSDAIRGVFFNNERRYTTEEEPDNLYYKRTYKADGYGNKKDGYNSGLTGIGESIPDDDWDYTYAADTTLYADKTYYVSDDEAYDAIEANESGYDNTVTVNNSTHVVSWTVSQDYLNVDLELDYKHKIHITTTDDDADDTTGLVIPNSYKQLEGYYSSAGSVTIDDISIASSSSCSYSFNGSASVKKKTGENTYETVADVTVTPYDSSDNVVASPATNAEDISYYKITGTMPSYDLYVKIGVDTKYTMKLNNTVICDTVSNKIKITQTTSQTKTPTGAETGAVGTIKAYVNYVKSDSTYDDEISSDETNRWVYNGNVYTDNNYGSNYYINGGINETGTAITKGDKVRYEFTFEDGKDAEYMFLGWFEGTSTSYDPTKRKGSGTTCEFTPDADKYIWAVATRNLYIQGDFNIDEDNHAEPTANSSTYGARYEMTYDAEYINGNIKGRYEYKFDDVEINHYYHYVFRDTATGDGDYSVWNSFQGQINANVAENVDSNVGTRWGRNPNSGDESNAGYFEWRTRDQNNGYECPVYVYFYPNAANNSDKLSVEAEYQWSTAYVSTGRGIDVTSEVYKKAGSADITYTIEQLTADGFTPADGYAYDSTNYNIPTVSVSDKTVNDEDVDVPNTPTNYGNEPIYGCKVKEKDGEIIVTAYPNDPNLDVQAFLVYDIESKKSSAVKDIEDNGDGSYTANIQIPQNTKMYVVPIYKFKDSYIEDHSETIESKTVYVRASALDKNDWGGLVSMYSWGAKGFDSGGWPGQLMIPDGKNFYAPLTYFKDGLAGVTFSNYNGIYGGNSTTFVGNYVAQGVSTVAYSGADNNTYQTYDYREPISIIDNISDGKYGDRDMDLTFELKNGGKAGAALGTTTYSSSYNFEYLMNRAGTKRVDLNGNDINNDLTATYCIVCSYTNDYYGNPPTKTYDFNASTTAGYRNEHSIDWTVYNADGSTALLSGSYLSASYTDGTVESGDFISFIASKLIAAGEPVDSRAVKIAYENSNDFGETVRYSGQWYVDGVDQTIDASVRVGVLSDGKYTVENTNKKSYGKATVSAVVDASKNEALTEEFSNGYSKVTLTKKKASNDAVTLTATNDNNTFIGWYRSDGEGGYEPVSNDYKKTSITISYTDNVTYYAFYQASATYAIKYPGRFSDLEDTDTWLEYTAKGQDLNQDELNDGGTLDLSVRSDMETVLAGANIRVFNRSYSVDLNSTPSTDTPFSLVYTASSSNTQYNLAVYGYNAAGTTLEEKTTVTNSWGTTVNLDEAYVANKPASHDDYVFYGWKKYNTSTRELVGSYITSHANFGFTLTEDLTIAPVFGPSEDRAEAIGSGWNTSIDKNEITQELTDSTSGTIYNDSLIKFQYGADSLKMIDQEHYNRTTGNIEIPENSSYECGLLIMAQAAESKETYGTAFNNITETNVQKYAKALREYYGGAGTNVGKLSSEKYGTAYIYRTRISSLSRLNRAHIYQALDYAKYYNGNYKVMAYYYDGSEYHYGNIISSTYTSGVKYPS